MHFKSKRDVFMGILYWLVIFMFIGIPIYNQAINLWTILFLFTPGALFIYIWFKTEYRLEEQILSIKYGPFIYKVPIKSIGTIRETTNPFVAPALSIDRLEINYANYKTISISPNKKEMFIKELVNQNPNIKIMK